MINQVLRAANWFTGVGGIAGGVYIYSLTQAALPTIASVSAGGVCVITALWMGSSSKDEQGEK